MLELLQLCCEQLYKIDRAQCGNLITVMKCLDPDATFLVMCGSEFPVP